ncbi:DNA-binding LytR/AlgR family response regulator [Mucilaginibacter sp. SG538B]|uniref:LytR/AlgR family response regulator transcription factor n=1 Tax=Mucilaginibacter sp. SG538B TaxID=2587021 RepID=UPI00159E502E|nr:LytTR family DNA-binding domain-containing protein [Mucilaginibacter sp. SG538B]NVM66899.1 DNA-binding LytR/AlgR family response regulator [Mucilaginibacter sp. SG538B]
MNAAIIDDEPPAITLLSSYIQRTKFMTLRAAFTDPAEAIGIYNGAKPPELTFLDIDMPGMNGLDFARIISGKTQIIFTTSFREYGPEAFELLACDYLLKPFSYERFLAAVGKLKPLQVTTGTNPSFFFVRTETRGKYLQVTVNDIVFIESNDNLVRITSNSGTVTAMHNLTEVYSWLPPEQFSRIHHSYIVNLQQVHAVDRGQVILKNGKIIPIGRQYKERFMATLEQLIIKRRQP